MNTYIEYGSDIIEMSHPLYANLVKDRIITISQNASDHADYTTLALALAGETTFTDETIFMVYPGIYTDAITISCQS